ncbi:HAMP domain-containing sensor histidine kinase [Spirulina major CS-329]|uniref:sensor histidine kinase n=2 Tax=Spirulinaceae TaxID=1890448 RepID=UPI002330D60A|nr:HAMP domain-containing sensor histidine kinase [Spirulina major]MDB9502019.1 HAMP domain-containing sensor histidine kinase [Spirulina major CS-329]
MAKQPKGFPSLGQIVGQSEQLDFLEVVPSDAIAPTHAAEAEWSAAIAALNHLLLNLFAASPRPCAGVVLAGPNPVLHDPYLLTQLVTGLFRPKSLEDIALAHFQLPAAADDTDPDPITVTQQEYPLVPNDPLADEQFCLVWTQGLGAVFVLDRDDQGDPAFHFSFSPEVLSQAWQALRSRLRLTCPHHVAPLDRLIAQHQPPTPDYRLITAFHRLMLKHLPQHTAPAAAPTIQINAQPRTPDTAPTAEVELLQALTHEVRTPLTTIRMLTRLVLKKQRTLADDVVKRLKSIDQECTDQINRMELIFRATELESQVGDRDLGQLIPISLQQIIQQHTPQWQNQAQRRNITLNIVLPEQLPTIISHPAMLAQVLTGLIERLTRSLPTGENIAVQVTTAGDQLKLQFLSQNTTLSHSLKSLGQLLMFQPETGCLSLNLDVTKNLCHAMGGKLTVRQRPTAGEVLTIFLPLTSYRLITP